MGNLRVGIGGWDYPPWRTTFYPKDVSQKKALAYASRQLTSIEINGTYYRSARPEHFAAWAAQTPDDFVFAVKASRYATNRKLLAEAGESIERFINSGLGELGDKLGPILWQLAATKQFDPDELQAFFRLLPARLGARKLRHVLDVRHPSFLCDDYYRLARKHKIATVITDSPNYPNIGELTGEFAYARLMNAQSEVATGYTRPALKKLAAQARLWQQGARSGDAYLYFINGAKERAPAAAVHLLTLL